VGTSTVTSRPSCTGKDGKRYPATRAKQQRQKPVFEKIHLFGAAVGGVFCMAD
jgi:hypothetical protein